MWQWSSAPWGSRPYRTYVRSQSRDPVSDGTICLGSRAADTRLVTGRAHLRSGHAAVGHQPRGRPHPGHRPVPRLLPRRVRRRRCSPTRPSATARATEGPALLRDHRAPHASSTSSSSPATPRPRTRRCSAAAPSTTWDCRPRRRRRSTRSAERLIERGSHRRLRHRLRRRHQPLLHRPRRARGRSRPRQPGTGPADLEAARHARGGIRARRPASEP